MYRISDDVTKLLAPKGPQIGTPDLKEIELDNIVGIRLGQDSKRFRENPLEMMEPFSFTIIHTRNGCGGVKQEELDLVAANYTDYVLWTEGLRMLLGNPRAAHLTGGMKIQVTLYPNAEKGLSVRNLEKDISYQNKACQFIFGGCLSQNGIMMQMGLNMGRLNKWRQNEYNQFELVCALGEEIRLLMARDLFIGHEFMPVAMVKLQYIEHKIQVAREAKETFNLDHMHESLFHAVAEAQALWFYLRTLKYKLKREPKE